MHLKEYFTDSAKTAMYQSAFTRRLLYNHIFLLVMFTFFASHTEGSFASEVFRLVAEGIVDVRYQAKRKRGYIYIHTTRSPTSPFFWPSFFKAAISIASGSWYYEFSLRRFELLQSLLSNCPRSKVNNELFFFVKTTSTSSVRFKTLSMRAWFHGGGRKYEYTNIKDADVTELDFWLSIISSIYHDAVV